MVRSRSVRVPPQTSIAPLVRLEEPTAQWDGCPWDHSDTPLHTSTVIESTSVESFELTVRRLKALADPTRLRVVHVLAGGKRCVCNLRDHVDVAPNVLSHHLRILREAGLVHAERRGRWIDYELDDAALDAVAAAVPASASVSAHATAARASTAREAATSTCACGAGGPASPSRP